MTKLTDNQIKHVAKLAKLDIRKGEFNKFKKQLSDVISYIDELSEVDTSEVKITSRVVESENVFRKDEIKPSLTKEEALSGKDDTYNGYFVVPAILENKEEDV